MYLSHLNRSTLHFAPLFSIVMNEWPQARKMDTEEVPSSALCCSNQAIDELLHEKTQCGFDTTFEDPFSRRSAQQMSAELLMLTFSLQPSDLSLLKVAYFQSTEWRGTFDASRLKTSVGGDAAALLRLTRHPHQHATISPSMKVRCTGRGAGDSGVAEERLRQASGAPDGRLIRRACACA